MMNNAIGPLVSSIVGKSMTPSVVQFGWDGGSLYESLDRAFSSFKLAVVPGEDHTEEDEEGAPEDIRFCSPNLLEEIPGKDFDFAVVDPNFFSLNLAFYMSLEGIVAENGLIVVPEGDEVERCRELLHEMAREGTTKCANGSHGKVRIFEVHDGRMIEML